MKKANGKNSRDVEFDLLRAESILQACVIGAAFAMTNGECVELAVSDEQRQTAAYGLTYAFEDLQAIQNAYVESTSAGACQLANELHHKQQEIKSLKRDLKKLRSLVIDSPQNNTITEAQAILGASVRGAK